MIGLVLVLRPSRYWCSIFRAACSFFFFFFLSRKFKASRGVYSLAQTLPAKKGRGEPGNKPSPARLSPLRRGSRACMGTRLCFASEKVWEMRPHIQQLDDLYMRWLLLSFGHLQGTHPPHTLLSCLKVHCFDVYWNAGPLGAQTYPLFAPTFS